MKSSPKTRAAMFLVAVALAALTACSNGGSSATPTLSTAGLARSPASQVVDANGTAGWKILDLVMLPNGSKNFATRHPDAIPGGGLSFPLLTDPQYPAFGQGYTSYMLANYNADISGKIITASVKVVNNGATFVSPPDQCFPGGTPPSVRLEFQDTAAGTFVPTDYWWSDAKGATTLLAASGGPVTLTGNTTDLSDWSDINGESASIKPAEFAAALQNVKEVSLSFGGGCHFANGVGVSSGSATFQLLSYSIK